MKFSEYKKRMEKRFDSLKTTAKKIFISLEKHTKKYFDWIQENSPQWKRCFDWGIFGVAFFLFLVLIFSEVLYVYFLGMRFYLTKVWFLLLYSVFFSLLLSLIKNTVLRRLALLLLVLLIGGLYFGEATYFAVFKMFAFWSQIVRIGELIGMKDQVGTFMNADFYVFFIPVICLLIFYFVEAVKVLWHGSGADEHQVLSFNQKILSIFATFLALNILNFYCAYGREDMNKLYLKNSVDYMNRYSLFDAFFLNSIKSVVPIFREPEPTPEEIEREFGIVGSNNAHTGLYKDKNIIFIEGESIGTYAVDPILTPTLYRMQSEGYSFDNYYSPRANTLNSEYAIMNSFYLTPEKEEEPFSAKASLAGLFKKMGYSTQAFHDFYGDFYNRDERLLQTGFDEFYDVGDLSIDFTWPEFPNDIELFVNSFPYIAGKDRFLAYYITMSGHASYEIEHRPSLNDNFERVKERFPDYDEYVQIYLAAAMVTDQGVEQLYADLERTGQLENTVIIFVGDHYPYGIEDEVLQETFHISTQLELYKTPFFIWDASRPSEVRSDLMSNVDVLPTFANLFGLDLKYSMGQDMFSDFVTDVIVEWYDFRTYSFLTPQGGYDGLLYEIIGDLTPEQVNEIQQRTYRREALNNSKYLRQLLSDDNAQEVTGEENVFVPEIATTWIIFYYKRVQH